MTRLDARAVSGLVSVIVPAYQAEAYLDEALVSALGQDHDAVEVIVVDDGSTDSTADIAASRPVRLLRQTNRGPAAARNAGLAVASGEFVTILDADDLWPSDRLSLQVAHLREHPHIGIVTGLTKFFVTPGDTRPPHHPQVAHNQALPGVAGTMLARREVFETIGDFDESLLLGEDIDWLARAKDAGIAAASLDRLALRYRMHVANTSRDTMANRTALLAILRDSVRRQRERVDG
jgi:glycosyltransferase involved in cell wall biosynthesis